MSDNDSCKVYGTTTRQNNLKWADPARSFTNRSKEPVKREKAVSQGAEGKGETIAKTLPKRYDQNSAKWADVDDFKSRFLCVDMSCGSLKQNTGGVPLMSDGRVAYVDPSDQHTLVIGSTGSKKSRLICMPTIDILAKAGESMMVTDPKGELYERSYSALVEHGYNIKVINLRKTTTGIRWNPFKIPYDLYRSGDHSKIDKAREMIQDLACSIIPVSDFVQDPYWPASAQGFLYGLAWTMITRARSEDEVNMRCLFRMKNDIMFDDISLMRFRRSFRGDEPEYCAMSGTLTNAAITRSCIMSFFDNGLRVLNSQDCISDLLSGNDIDFTRLGHEKTALFIIVPDEKDTYNQIVSICVKQLYEMLIMEAQNCERQSLPVRVNFVLDEFASFPKISNMQNMISASRSRNIRFLLIIQSAKQLTSVYGNDAGTIKGNCMNWIFLTSRDVDMMNELCEIVGKDENGVELISTTRLRTLDKDKGEALVLSGRLDPIITNLADVDQYDIKISDDVEYTPREITIPKTFSVFRMTEVKKKKTTKKAAPSNNTGFSFEPETISESVEWKEKVVFIGGIEFAYLLNEPPFKEMPHNDKTLCEAAEMVKSGHDMIGKGDAEVRRWCTDNQVFVGMDPGEVCSMMDKIYKEIF